jgi:excisionase family DNA binding protein
VFSEALAESHVPVFDVATRYSELGDALLPIINPVVGAKYGLEITSFIVENVSVPQEVEQAIDKRSGMAAVGNLNDFVKYQMAQGMESGGAGAGGTAAELAVGFGMAQQMMQQGLMKPQADAAMKTAPAAGAAAPAVDLLGPADVAKALGVSEEDVMAVITSGELKAKKIGASYRVTRAALDAYLAQ